LFQKQASGWVQTQKLKASDAEEGDNLGEPVACPETSLLRAPTRTPTMESRPRGCLRVPSVRARRGRRRRSSLPETRGVLPVRRIRRSVRHAHPRRFEGRGSCGCRKWGHLCVRQNEHRVGPDSEADNPGCGSRRSVRGRLLSTETRPSSGRRASVRTCR
jgi:hypothetical protein